MWTVSLACCLFQVVLREHKLLWFDVQDAIDEVNEMKRKRDQVRQRVQAAKDDLARQEAPLRFCLHCLADYVFSCSSNRSFTPLWQGFDLDGLLSLAGDRISKKSHAVAQHSICMFVAGEVFTEELYVARCLGQRKLRKGGFRQSLSGRRQSLCASKMRATPDMTGCRTW